MIQSLFLIPIHINALHLNEGRTAVEPMANFSRLPYFDGERDVNRNFGHISELIVSSPFQNTNLYLPAGMHLHWELPQALSKGIPKDNSSLEFPTVPNRWLVIRKRKQTNTEKWLTENSWIIESDYLWEIGQESKSISIPLATQQGQKYQPFRYLGRQISLESWLKQSGGEYWGKSLTAVGYGEPTFAAFYPNCYSIFGCHDAQIRQIEHNLSYEIFGWYSDKEYDYLRSYIQQFEQENKQEKLTEKLLFDFQEKLNWKIPEEEFNQLQKQGKFSSNNVQLLCYGRIEFQPKQISNDSNLDLTSVILANSGTEALSAYLATEVAGNTKIEKRTIENLLEALQLATTLQDYQIDLESKLQDARHEKGFTATSVDLLWIIEQVNQKAPNAGQTESQADKTFLPENMATLLLEVNQLQRQYNRAKHEIESRRQQLFADWYKYILCTYPPIGRIAEYPSPNLVRYFIENQGVAPLQKQVSEVGNLLLGKNDLGKIIRASSDQNNNCLANQLATRINTLIEEIKKVNESEEVKKANLCYQPRVISSPRYWQPNEPVVMIVGDIVQSTSTNQKTNNSLLNCSIWQDPSANVSALLNQDKNIDNINVAIQVLIDKLEELIPQNKQGLTIWSQETWQPFLLEWQAGIDTAQNEIGSRSYSNTLILQNYRVTPKLVDLEKIFQSQVKNSTDVYRGRNILTPYAALQQEEKLKEYFQKQPVFDEYCQIKNCNKLSWDWLKNKDLCQWIEEQKNLNKEKKEIYIALVKVYQKLQETKCLSQCLGGFNQALLGCKQTLQLNIKDPIGFEIYESFVKGVAQAIQQSISSAPQPLNFFNPIRLGTLKIQRLILVDTFGTGKDVPLSERVITPEYLKAWGNDPNAIALPPRLVQPARISFRWLSGNPQYEGESGSHPSLSPICGWILSDRIDRTIEIYNAAGRSLGELEVRKVGEQRWRPAPGSSQAVSSIAEIPNLYLRKVVEYLDQKEDEFLERFVLALSTAWDNIEPNNFDSSPSIALLMGQPMAIVRASINLELQGFPAVNQDWGMFRQDLRRTTREHNGFPRVNFPLRLGDYRRKGDGLIGYWLENQSGNLSESVYIPQAELSELDKEQGIITDLHLINQSIQSEPQIVTMLIDHRASVHLISGILPTKAINVLPEHYVDALSAIETTFLTAPILTPSKMYLPILEEQGYSWSWLEKGNRENQETWSEISSIGEIQECQFITTVEQQIPDLDAKEAWNYLLQADVYWLKNSEANQAFKEIVPFENRKEKELIQPYKRKQKQIEFILDLCSIKIRQAMVEANFSEQEIREGWLKLKKNS